MLKIKNIEIRYGIPMLSNDRCIIYFLCLVMTDVLYISYA
jgi:hypothetical protein